MNPILQGFANYYQFRIHVCNGYKGNEKGYVVESVKYIRNQAFSQLYAFDSLKEAREYLQKKLEEINVFSQIEEE